MYVYIEYGVESPSEKIHVCLRKDFVILTNTKISSKILKFSAVRLLFSKFCVRHNEDENPGEKKSTNIN